jgi:uncharacterized membrane protein YesL
LQNFFSKFNLFGDWIYRLVLLNFLWIGFSILGGLIFGIFPATAAMFTLLRKWMIQRNECHLFKDFALSYKDNFIKSNLIGFTILGIWLIVWIDLSFLLESTNIFAVIFSYLLMAVLLSVSISMLVLFPVFAHYEMSYVQYIVQVLKYPIVHVKQSFFIGVILVIYSLLLFKFPSILPFLGTSLVVFSIAKVLFPTFDKKYKKKQSMYEVQREESLYY